MLQGLTNPMLSYFPLYVVEGGATVLEIAPHEPSLLPEQTY